jgi:transcriptional regulator
MYLPPHFQQPDKDIIHQLMQRAPMATLVTQSGSGLEANHLPMLPELRGEETILRFHVARANPVWRDTEPGTDVLAIFQGPDTYISPSWYATKKEHGKVVPTWNYAVVHAYGKLAVHDDRQWLRRFLPALTAVHEKRFAQPWQVEDAPADYLDKMMGAIVGLEIAVTRLVAKWKISQNQPAANKATLLAGLRATDQPGAAAMAQLLAQQLDTQQLDTKGTQ